MVNWSAVSREDVCFSLLGGRGSVKDLEPTIACFEGPRLRQDPCEYPRPPPHTHTLLLALSSGSEAPISCDANIGVFPLRGSLTLKHVYLLLYTTKSGGEQNHCPLSSLWRAGVEHRRRNVEISFPF